jgi:predicted ferric reductase
VNIFQTLPPHISSRLPGSFKGQGWAGLMVLGIAAYAVSLSLIELVGAVGFRMEAGTLWLAGDEQDPLYESGSSLGFYAAILFALNFVLATRWRWMEGLFGGASRVYSLHSFVGRAALTFVLIHTGLLVLQALPDWSLAADYVVPGRDWAYTLGVVGTIGLLALVAMTIWIKMPYRGWLKTHKLMIIPFLGGMLHAILLQADWYIMLVAVIGIFAWFDGVFLLPRRGIPVRVKAARTLGRTRELVLTPQASFPAAPGSFVLLGYKGERHPFSISGIEPAGQIRLSVNMSGPFTRSLARVEVGDVLSLHGPHGHFGSDVLASTVPQLWIAGGIGITPFLSLGDALARVRPEQQLHIIWSVRGSEQAVYRAEIESKLVTMPNARLTVHDTRIAGHLTVARASAICNFERVFICGPVAMADELATQFKAAGVAPENIITERFALR